MATRNAVRNIDASMSAVLHDKVPVAMDKPVNKEPSHLFVLWPALLL
jgi:hypothetical protein